MAGDSAITPDAPILSSQVVEEADEVINPELEQARREEQDIADLAAHPGWQLFKQRFAERVETLRDLRSLDTSNMTFDEIGQRFVVAHLAADIIETELAGVDNLADNVTREPKRGQ